MAAVATRSSIHSPFDNHLDAYSAARSDFAFDSPLDLHQRRHENGLPMSRLRASSDPISRGGAFSLDDPNGHLLEHEPNPFEQSFSGPHDPRASTHHAQDPTRVREPTVNAVASSSGLPPRRARSNSPIAFPRNTPTGVSKLPPLAHISTPSNELSNFGWGVDSLRTGPLSPALLNGPPSHSLYDPSNLRTGLTPLASSSVSFPPPSPATAALFAMMTNNTPGTADPAAMAGGGPRPHEGPNEGNHFDASFARAAEDKINPDHRRQSVDDAQRRQSLSHQQQSIDYQNNHLHRSALSSALGSQPPRAIAPQVMHPSHLANQIHPGYNNNARYGMDQQQQMANHQQQLHHQQQQQQMHHPHHPQPPQQAQYGNQNPLYLLSQASSHNDDAVVAAAALSNLGGPAGYAPVDQMQNVQMNGIVPGAIGGGHHVAPPSQIQTRGNKGVSSPASTNGSAPSAPANNKRGAAATKAAAGANKRKKAEEDKKPAPAAKKGGRRAKVVEKDEDEDEDDDEDAESLSPQPHNPNETEEEKRKNFLERNRQAALKCRQRKKAWLANLQTKVELLTTDNDTLQGTVTNLKDEIASLRAILAAHSNCPIAISNADHRNAPPQHYNNGGQRF